LARPASMLSLYRTALEHLGVRGYPKTTGKRGIQIWVPVADGYTFEDTRTWVEKGVVKNLFYDRYWAQRQALAAMGDVDVAAERWVHDGNVVTAAGVSAGIDMALYLVGVIKGAEAAKRLQKAIEYDPAPPYAEPATSP